jgi:hypothetical protein
VVSDTFPNSFVSWYNKETKNVVSFEDYYAAPLESKNNYVPIKREEVDNFFEKSMQQFLTANDKISQNIQKITDYLSEQQILKASDFLKLV